MERKDSQTEERERKEGREGRREGGREGGREDRDRREEGKEEGRQRKHLIIRPDKASRFHCHRVAIAARVIAEPVLWLWIPDVKHAWRQVSLHCIQLGARAVEAHRHCVLPARRGEGAGRVGGAPILHDPGRERERNE